MPELRKNPPVPPSSQPAMCLGCSQNYCSDNSSLPPVPSSSSKSYRIHSDSTATQQTARILILFTVNFRDNCTGIFEGNLGTQIKQQELLLSRPNLPESN